MMFTATHKVIPLYETLLNSWTYEMTLDAGCIFHFRFEAETSKTQIVSLQILRKDIQHLLSSAVHQMRLFSYFSLLKKNNFYIFIIRKPNSTSFKVHYPNMKMQLILICFNFLSWFKILNCCLKMKTNVSSSQDNKLCGLSKSVSSCSH